MTRHTPALPVKMMQTYSIKSPRSTHTRAATCAEYRCKGHVRGWTTVVPVASLPPGGYTADYVRKVNRGEVDGIRRHAVEAPRDGGLIAFRYEPGQSCFRQSTHRVPLDRPELYVVRRGDWRGYLPGSTVRHTGPDPWINDLGETLDGLRRVLG